MKCDFEFCIHQSNNQCTLDHIEIDMAGLCNECVIVQLNTNVLEAVKAFARKKHEEERISSFEE